ncbi:PTS system, Fru family, IIC component domain protein [Escherichia coli 5-172-05_S3_C3]|nr:PTS fructose transporter subunit EIIC [Escherichia coli]EYD79415.1 PTS system, Fru family, IIC component domain protein [Escherichia coli 1-176-05_S3_C1]KEL43211.1 PTS system, Fru family, IIC component domain protein [Escherichia coli 5-172-05_S3_C3]
MNELVQILKNTRQHLMTGVSHMIPFVVSGGILLAVSVMLYGKGAVPDAVADPNLKKLFDIGVAGLTLMVPFLAAYIGYSIAERSALAPCAIGAWVGNSFGAGFFGALIAGIIGGIVVHYLKKIPVHKVLRSVMPIFIIPIVGTLITAGIMMWGLGEPVGALTNSLTQWLQGMQQGSIVMLAVIMGLMLAFDMGGPVNKVAYAFMLICVAQGVYTVVAIAAVGICIPPLGMQQGSIVMLAVIMGLMLAFDMGGPVNKVAYAFMLICVAQGVYTVVAIAAVGICIPPLGMQQGSIVMLAVIMGLMLAFDMGGPVNKVAYAFMLICVAQGVYTVVAIAAVGICIPPLGMGLATLIGRKNFSAEERETGKAALVMGCVGVTEGAIPFAAADPLRVIPSIMVGSVCGAVTAALVGAQCYAGWGGLIVLPVVEGKLGYIAAVAVGAVVTAVCVNVLKSLARKNGSSTDEKEDDLDLDFEIN